MKENIICSGALFYATSTKRFLFLQRTDSKTKGLWGLVGGQAHFTESAFEGLKREIEEEVGDTLSFTRTLSLLIVNLFLNLIKNILDIVGLPLNVGPRICTWALRTLLITRPLKANYKLYLI